MSQLKTLIAIKKCLELAQININNLDYCINKCCWQNELNFLIKDVNEEIKHESSKQ